MPTSRSSDSIIWILNKVFELLMGAYGPQRWWPAQSAFEMIVGSILVQSVAWRNVQTTIAGLKSAGLLSPAALRHIPELDLARLCYSSGYYNAKARKLKSFADHLGKHGDDLEAWFGSPVEQLRAELLSIHGVGPETADSILLYAAGKPVFVVDSITRRIVDRVGVGLTLHTYDEYQRLFENNLPSDSDTYGEYHALLVELSKRHCLKTSPDCSGCPLSSVCSTGSERLEISLARAGV